MAQTGYTPILIYSSSTVSQAPAAGNLTNSTLGSELAINITDGKLFYKDNANAIQVIAWKTTPTTAGGTGLTSYTAGDLLYYATGTTLSKLAIGASKTILTSSGSAPQWSTSLDTSQGGTGLTSYTAGDLTYYATGTALTKLAIGANTYILASNGTAPTWVAPSTVAIGTATNLSGGAAGSLPYQTAASTTTMLGIGTAYQHLGVNAGGTAPEWQASANSVLTAQGDLLYASAANTLARLAKNTTATRYLANTGSNNNPSWDQVNLANGVTGLLPIGNGGTGLTSFNANQLVFSNATGLLTQSSNLTYDGTTFTTIATQNFKGVTTTLGNSAGQANNAAILRFNGWNTGGANWQIDTASISATNELAFTPSTAAGGLTFTTLSHSFRTNGTIGLTVSGSTSGAGITFPATQSASTNANTLDDYEEGTWTPSSITNGANTSSLSWTGGDYTKIGNVVTIRGQFTFTVTTSNVLTYVNLGSLPFTPINQQNGIAFANNDIAIGDIQLVGLNAVYVFWPAASELASGSEIGQINATYIVS